MQLKKARNSWLLVLPSNSINRRSVFFIVLVRADLRRFANQSRRRAKKFAARNAQAASSSALERFHEALSARAASSASRAAALAKVNRFPISL
jgi:hypothetical protein